MSTGKYLLILLTTTLSAWLIGKMTIKSLFHPAKAIKTPVGKIQGALPYFQENHASTAGTYAKDFIVPNDVIERKLSEKAILDKLKPSIESHVDQFLNEKLSAVFPLLYKFMGEKTLAQFKSAFLTEIDNILPVLISQFAVQLKNNIPVEQLVQEKIELIELEKMETIFYEKASKQILLYELSCALIGLLTGLLIVLIVRW
jgi:uncharacterized membrane protein YheB (UPF0754 family)